MRLAQLATENERKEGRTVFEEDKANLGRCQDIVGI